MEGGVRRGGKELTWDRHKHSQIMSASWEDTVPQGERMHSTDVAFRREPGREEQLCARKLQDLEVEMTWREAQEPGQAPPQAQAPPEWCNRLLLHVYNHSLGVFFFSIFRKRQPEFSPSSQCPSAHVQL